jgi:hypothetical protein
MRIPGFNAEAALGAPVGHYRGEVVATMLDAAITWSQILPPSGLRCLTIPPKCTVLLRQDIVMRAVLIAREEGSGLTTVSSVVLVLLATSADAKTEGLNVYAEVNCSTHRGAIFDEPGRIR